MREGADGAMNEHGGNEGIRDVRTGDTAQRGYCTEGMLHRGDAAQRECCTEGCCTEGMLHRGDTGAPAEHLSPERSEL